MEQVKIGIDPGLGGAIAFVKDSGITIHDMPVMTIPWSSKTATYKTMVDLNKLIEIFDCSVPEVASVNIEIVHSMPKQGPASTWTFSGAFHIALAAAIGYYGWDKINMVLPTQWKKKFGLINMPKDMARLVCLKMYPFLEQELKRKKDVDRADAILIAGY